MDETSSSFSASSAPQLRFGKIDDLSSRVAAAVDGARKFLFSQQHEEGYWCGELVADTTLESDYILLHTLLGTGNPERALTAASVKQLASAVATVLLSSPYAQLR